VHPVDQQVRGHDLDVGQANRAQTFAHLPIVIDTMSRMVKSADPDIQLVTALADPTRTGILHELAGASEVCACNFTSCCTVSQPTISHHLKVLREAGAVTSERRGNWVFYRIAPNLQVRLAGIAGSLVAGGRIPAASLRRRVTSAGDGVGGQQPA
jgi:ArsR family transcriptional regulator